MTAADRSSTAGDDAPEDTTPIGAGDDHPDTSGEPGPLRNTIEWVGVIVGALVVALLVRSYLFQAFSIPSSSMESTLEISDRLLVNKFSYDLEDIERGDIVVFAKPPDLPSPYDDLIKRVVGLPGDVVEARDNTVFVNDQALVEPYLDPGAVTGDFGPIEVPAGHVFVMGDNRSNSTDSRSFGAISADQIAGQAFLRYWPLNRIGTP